MWISAVEKKVFLARPRAKRFAVRGVVKKVALMTKRDQEDKVAKDWGHLPQNQAALRAVGINPQHGFQRLANFVDPHDLADVQNTAEQIMKGHSAGGLEVFAVTEFLLVGASVSTAARERDIRSRVRQYPLLRMPGEESEAASKRHRASEAEAVTPEIVQRAMALNLKVRALLSRQVCGSRLRIIQVSGAAQATKMLCRRDALPVTGRSHL